MYLNSPYVCRSANTTAEFDCVGEKAGQNSTQYQKRFYKHNFLRLILTLCHYYCQET